MDTYLQRLQEAIINAIRGMTTEDLMRHPEGKWSAAEVLEHLYLTYTGTVKGFERCLASGKPGVGSPTLKQQLSKAVVVGVGYMPGGRQAPESTRPKGMPAEKVIAEIAPKIAAMDALIAQCEARFGKRTRVVHHTILGPLTPQQWRKFHWVHGQHHMQQILRLRGTH